jgi:hypothetical protein
VTALAQVLPLLLWLLAGAAAALAVHRLTRGELPLIVLSVGCTVLAIAFLLLVPVGTAVSVRTATTAAPGTTGATMTTRAQTRQLMFLETQGAGALRLLLVPVGIAALPLAARPVRRARTPAVVLSTLLLGVVTLLGAASLGLLYAPSTLAMALALARRRD